MVGICDLALFASAFGAESGDVRLVLGASVDCDCTIGLCNQGWCLVMNDRPVGDELDDRDGDEGDDDEGGGGGPSNDSDYDGIPDGEDCDSSEYGGDPLTDCGCLDDDGDGVRNQDDCDSSCYAGDPSEDCACQDDDQDGKKNQDDCDSSCFAAGNCGAYEIRGPKYAGVYATVNLDLGSCEASDPEWVIESGEGLVEHVEIVGDAFVIELGDTLGEVDIECVFMSGDVTCTVTHTLHVLEYDQISLRYRAFIPCPAVPGPPGSDVFGYHFFGGDDRTFSHTSSAYRAHFELNVRVSDYHEENDLVLPSIGAPFGVTTAYDQQGGEVVAGACDVALLGPAPVASATLVRTSANHIINWGRIDGEEITVKFGLNAGMPLFDFGLTLSCVIGVAIYVNLRQAIDPDDGRQTLEYMVVGFHSEFPAHELYIETGAGLVEVLPPTWPTGVGQYDPIPLGLTVLDLCFPDMQNVSYAPGEVQGTIETSPSLE